MSDFLTKDPERITKRCTINRGGVILKGACEISTVVQSDFGTVTLTTKDGDLAILKITNHSFGSSFEHLDDDALEALQGQIEAHLVRKKLRARQVL